MRIFSTLRATATPCRRDYIFDNTWRHYQTHCKRKGNSVFATPEPPIVAHVDLSHWSENSTENKHRQRLAPCRYRTLASTRLVYCASKRQPIKSIYRHQNRKHLFRRRCTHLTATRSTGDGNRLPSAPLLQNCISVTPYRALIFLKAFSSTAAGRVTPQLRPSPIASPE